MRDLRTRITYPLPGSTRGGVRLAGVRRCAQPGRRGGQTFPHWRSKRQQEGTVNEAHDAKSDLQCTALQASPSRVYHDIFNTPRAQPRGPAANFPDGITIAAVDQRLPPKPCRRRYPRRTEGAGLGLLPVSHRTWARAVGR